MRKKRRNTSKTVLQVKNWCDSPFSDIRFALRFGLKEPWNMQKALSLNALRVAMTVKFNYRKSTVKINTFADVA
jgi:hypothetical protein